MGEVQVKAASIRLKGADGKLAMQSMPVKGTVVTLNIDGKVTDSAAAGTALATGYKTKNGIVSMAPDGRMLRTILEAARDSGKSTGLVVTCTMSHATPAVFGSHVSNRGSEYEIAGQLIASRVNVLFGGGRSFFGAAKAGEYVGLDILDKKGKKLLWIKDFIDWTEYRLAERGLALPSGAVKANVWAWRDNGAIPGYLDDVSLVGKDAKDGKETGNLLANGDFEKGDLSGWTSWSGCEIADDGGSKALKVGAGGLNQEVGLKGLGECVLTYRARVGTAGSAIQPIDEAVKAGYRIIGRKEEMAGASGRYVLGLFKPGALEGKPEEPTLAEMTSKALDLLSANENGFFIMVEGSQIDWANHANDEKYFLREMAGFDEAVAAALDFAGKKGDILVITTADHETGGMSMAGEGATMKIRYSSKDHTGIPAPLFAYGPGSEKFAGAHDNTEVPKLIAEALGVGL
jgi:alkaline phosphatase